MTPTTKAGRALLAGGVYRDPNYREEWTDAILAIEAEAAAQERERIRAAVDSARYSGPDGEHDPAGWYYAADIDAILAEPTDGSGRCPECGATRMSRGMGSHRHYRHGVTR